MSLITFAYFSNPDGRARKTRATVPRLELFSSLLVYLYLVLVHAIGLGLSPYRTYTVGVGNALVESQNAFEPVGKITFYFGKVSDFDYWRGKLYLADVDNARIVVYDLRTGEVLQHIGEGELLAPEGIFVDDLGYVLVADSFARAVLKFAPNGELELRIERPDSPIYGSTNDFVPQKVAADKRGNIYVVCQGVTNGLAVFNQEGRFLSFYGANRPKVTLRMALQRLVFTEAQKRQLLKIRPPSPTNLTVDELGTVWTVTSGLTEDAIKRFNVAGVNIYPTLSFHRDDFIDLVVDRSGNAYALSATGNVLVYDSLGNLIFLFGGQSFYENRIGLFRVPASIDLTEDGQILVLDKEDSSITILSPTKFGQLVLRGVQLYNQGLYLESEDVWREVRRLNSTFMLTYRVLGNIEFKRGNYDTAFEHFRLAQDSKGYSDAFWYIRNERLQRGVGIVFVALVFIAGGDLLRTLLLRQGVLRPKNKRKRKLSAWEEQARNVLNFLKNPFDAVYELKRRDSVSTVTAIVLYALLYLENILVRLIGSPLFFGFESRKIDFSGLFFDTYRLPFLFVLSNYLVSEISEGEGRLKDIFVGTIASFLPYLIFSVPLALLTNALTLNESFVYTFGMQVIWAWSLVLLFIVIAQIHNFSFAETVKNLLLTLFAMFLISLLGILAWTVLREEIALITSIVEELMFRAKR